MIKGFNHIGICVYNIDDTLKKMQKTMGARLISKTEYPDLHQISAIVILPDNTSKFELMQPIGEEGVVARFLNKHGEGFHHLSLLTDDLTLAISDFTSNQCQLLSQSKGLAFFSPKTNNGILYEISDGTYNKK